MSILGFIPISAAESLAQTQQILANTFGITTDINPVGANGIFIQQLTDLNIQVNNVQTLLYGGLYNPNIASGVYLYSICALLGIEPIAATPSFATCQIAGLVGTIIPNGSQILNANGDIFELTSGTITITGISGLDVGTFTAIVVGVPLAVDADTLTRIVQQVPGWDTVNNSAAGVLGAPAQTDMSLRYTRKQQLAINATNSNDSIIAGLQSLIPTIITDFIVLNNNTISPATIAGVTVPANSIYVSVVQVGSDTPISALLYDKVPGGIPLGGSYTPPIWYNPKYPWVTFQAKWQQAVVQQAVIAIDITQVNYPFGTADAIKVAILFEWYNGTINTPPINMRSGTIYANQFISTIVALGVITVNAITITTVALGTPGATLTQTADNGIQLQLANITITGI